MAKLVRWGIFYNGIVLFMVAEYLRTCDAQKKNDCPTYGDYRTVKNNPKCWYNFNAVLNFPSVVRNNGYDCEEYKVQTEDGFILGLFKIPGNERYGSEKKNFPVYIQHGIYGSSAVFVSSGKNSLAFLLADAGYDVWLGNYRGNEYSEEHVNYTTKDREFWDHTLDEFVQYDSPAILNYILERTPGGGQIIYIGYSLGTTIGLMYSSKYPEEAKHKIKLMILTGPAYTLSHMKSPYKWLAPLGKPVLVAVQWIGLMRVVSQAVFIKEFLRIPCTEHPSMIRTCVLAWNIFYGLGSRLRPEIVPVHRNLFPAGTSYKVLVHITDLIAGNFRHYNHGYKKNIRRYGTRKPPIYDIKKIQIPIQIVYSTSDWATTEKDALNLYHKLPKEAIHGVKRISDKNFNHLDFLLAKEAKTIVYDDLLNIINDVLPKEEGYDVKALLPQHTIVRQYGYDFEEYKVETKDGFILSLFKIPSRNRYDSVKKYFPVYLQHGLLSTASNFVAIGKDSLAFNLADEGHDVWLGNFRGNEYSESHVNYTTADEEFWDHTLDDIVQYDFPAIFNQILERTPVGGQIIYIGHSLGTTVGLMFSSKYPKEAKHLFKLMILLCPAYTLTNMISPYRLGAPFGPMILDTTQRMKMMRLLSQAETTRTFMTTLCLEHPRLMIMCLRSWNLFYGLGTRMRPELVPVFFHQLPGGTSMKIGNHAADIVLGNFRHYDHGPKENLWRYGTERPPIYNIKKIEIPIYIVYSTGDWATSEKDALNLYSKLPKVARHGIRRISERNFNHIDFLFAKEAKNIVYDDLLDVMRKILPD
ncbi:uncharacterized protein LOC123310406 [Coccinella septempunctata]|uniref:uncharacterized protein LOC123310406 n=1 Tax=Coccinella septempunctata TaxID=41139 RepID=UPI001D08270E|nr:uncharacterized protein LOC123310406 [Coccinella septempunctata]